MTTDVFSSIPFAELLAGPILLANAPAPLATTNAPKTATEGMAAGGP